VMPLVIVGVVVAYVASARLARFLPSAAAAEEVRSDSTSEGPEPPPPG
jgi:hypothetical protein